MSQIDHKGAERKEHLNAQRVLVDGDHFGCRQDLKDLAREVTDVTSKHIAIAGLVVSLGVSGACAVYLPDEERRLGKCPKREVRLLFGVREALVAHLQLDHQTHTQRSRAAKKMIEMRKAKIDRERERGGYHVGIVEAAGSGVLPPLVVEVDAAHNAVGPRNTG
jgi:hypothetical protein